MLPLLIVRYMFSNQCMSSRNLGWYMYSLSHKLFMFSKQYMFSRNRGWFMFSNLYTCPNRFTFRLISIAGIRAVEFEANRRLSY